jgi:hypothetical protein
VKSIRLSCFEASLPAVPGGVRIGENSGRHGKNAGAGLPIRHRF